jgi:hypothetical protein
VGFFEQRLMTDDLGTDLAIAAQIRAAGGTDVEVRVNYTKPQSSDVGPQWNTLCVAAEAAQHEGLTLAVNFQTYRRGGYIGWVPETRTELKQFGTFLVSFEAGLAGPPYTGDDSVAHRCPNLTRPFKTFRFSIGGEPNYELLFKPQFDAAGTFVASQLAVNLMAYEAPLLRTRRGRCTPRST